jgi:2-(1,2-epoxy-1,2-dihydrophenyl)acetyl-CoA isomerase
MESLTPTWNPTNTRFEAVLLESATAEGRATDVFRLTLNRPDTLNALNAALFDEIPSAVGAAQQAGARALIITGAGRGFCSGADLMQGTMDPAATRAEVQHRARMTFSRVIRLVTTINEARMPVISAINGVAAGGGVGVALAGDIALLTFVPRLGIVPDVSATWLMTRMAGRARTLGASLTGDPISAEEALGWGLVYRLVEDHQLADASWSLALRLANGPIDAIRETRRLIDLATSVELAQHLDIERDVQVSLIGAPDNAEGVLAFREKRPGNYRRT